jgi:hypothetical protein
MSSKPVLRIDWATHEAAKYACEKWHYTCSVPMPPIVKIGVWEDEKFVGVVLFSRGASPALGSAYDLSQLECCELTRVALRDHATPVSRIISIAIRFLKRSNEGLRLIVSFADPSQGHHGGVYQAGGWVYSGDSDEKTDFIAPNGKRLLSRQVSSSGFVRMFGKMTKTLKRSDCTPVNLPGKHRYLMPLDDAIRAKIAPLAKPYPKSTRVKKQDSGHPSELGGAVPTDTLHLSGAPCP